MMKVVQGTFRQIPYWKLRGRFHSCGYRDQEVAEHSGIGRYTMSARMNGHQPWTSKEIAAICELLDIRQDEIGAVLPGQLGRRMNPHENQIWSLVLAGNGLLCGGPAVRPGAGGQLVRPLAPSRTVRSSRLWC